MLSFVLFLDITFLEDWCETEHNQLTEIQNMADMNSLQGNSFTELNTISLDWLSGNMGLDFFISEPSCQKSVEPNATDVQSYSDASHSIYSSPTEDPSASLLQASLPETENVCLSLFWGEN